MAARPFSFIVALPVDAKLFQHSVLASCHVFSCTAVLPSRPAGCAAQKVFPMFDRHATALLKPGVIWLARRLAAAGVGANALTF